jgi:predicted GH43/DUF377 family glycosyl hydrolase
MKNVFFKLLLLITVLVVSANNSLAQYEWTKYPTNPLNIHGSPGSWDESLVTPCVIFNPDSDRYEMWYGTFDGTYPNNGIGFAWSTDGITWTKHPTAVMTPSATGWDSLSVGECSVIKEGDVYKMWYTGHQNASRTPSYIGYATSTDGGLTWEKYSGNPVLSPGSGWESARVEFPSVIKVSGGYWMFYTGELSHGIARTGRAFSADGITWQKDTVNNPVLLPGDPGEWDQNNYLGNVIELNNTLYIYYTGETNPGVSGTAIGVTSSTDMGITWTKYSGNPIVQRGTAGQWDNGWIETGCAVFAHNQLKLYYDGGGDATGWLGRIGLAISDPLPAGTYTIGSGGNFASIQDAFDRLETDGIAGPITLELIDEFYQAPADTFGFLLDGPILGAGPNSRITIKPAENKNVILEGNWKYVITFRNVCYLTFDGISTEGSTTLTIHSLYNSQYVDNRGIGFLENSDHNVAQNLIIICDDITRFGVGIMFRASENSLFAPDSNLIQNNFIKKAGCGINVSAAWASANTRHIGNIIKGNKVGSETDSLIAWGIQVEKSQNTIIEDNIVQNMTFKNGYNWDNVNKGINSYWCDGNIIRNNIVHDIKGSGGNHATGIQLSGDVGNAGNNNLIYNNIVYNIQSTSTQSDSRVAGIQIWQQNNPKIYYNSVYLAGTGSNHSGSAAFYIHHNCTNVEAKNNILINTRDESPYYASAIYDYSASNLTSDYNDLYANNYLVRIGNTNYNTLTDWQLMGKDLNSLVEMPHFISSTDLHIDESIATYLESRATPIAEIGTDFDGDIRNSSTPDIGADEFEGIPPVGIEEETLLPTEFALEQNYPNPFNPGTTIKYSIPKTSKVTLTLFNLLGEQVTTLVNEEKNVGNYSVEFNASKLPSGVYFYQLKATPDGGQAGSFVETKKMILLR